MRKPLILGVILVGVVVALVVWLRRPAATTGSQPVVTSGSSVPKALTAPQESPPSRVRRLGAEERKQLGERIVAARERARTPAATQAATQPTHAGSAPALADDTIRLEQVSTTVQAALKEAIPILAECYGDKPAGATATVVMAMTSDPDLGAVIDTDALSDHEGKPLASTLDNCLRDAIESLALPPLEVGGRLPLQYSFVFD